MRALVVLTFGILAALAGTAHAYPQFQVSRDQMCTSCHLSPSGGGLLTENGLNTADITSQFGHNPEFMYGKLKPPEWLELGGDIRAMGGYHKAPQQFLEAFPMQGDLYARATYEDFSFHATVGFRPAQEGNEALTHLYAREHYVQWQDDPSSAEGIYIRIGHLMPIFGLRLAEHPIYTRRYGGTPLFSETYGATASYIKDGYEGHVSGFIVDPLMDGVRRENGGAAYGELRVNPTTQIGAGAMLEANDNQRKYRGAVTAKQYLESPGLLFQGEFQFVSAAVGSTRWNQTLGYLMSSYMLTNAILVDLGLGYYNEDIKLKNVARYNADLNVHWFLTSHFEALLVSRYERIGITAEGGGEGAWVMLQGHYRL